MLALLRRPYSGSSPPQAEARLAGSGKAGRARKQLDALAKALGELGATVQWCEASVDSVPPFLESDAVVLPEVAIMARMDDPVRAAAVDSLASLLAEHRPVQRLPDDARLEASDIVRMDRTLYVGRSSRTNDDGIAGLREIVEAFDYDVRPVQTRDDRPLRAACSFIPPNFLLVNPAWLDAASIGKVQVVPIAESDSGPASVVAVDNTTLLSASLKGTAVRLKSLGVLSQTIEISEWEKAGGHLSALCLLIEARRGKTASADAGPRLVNIAEVPALLGQPSQAVVHGGLVHVAPLLPFAEAPPGKGVPIADQGARVFHHLTTVLTAAGSSMERVLRVTIHLKDVALLDGIEREYARTFGGHKPIRSVIENRALPTGVAIAIEGLAAVS